MIDGKVSLPDLCIEYTNQEMEVARVDPWTWNWQRTTTMPGILPKKRVAASKSMLGPKMSQVFAAFETSGKS